MNDRGTAGTAFRKIIVSEGCPEGVTQGPEKLLRYRAMQQKVRDLHGLNVPRDLVYAVMGEADPQGLEASGEVGQSNRPLREKCLSFYCK